MQNFAIQFEDYQIEELERNGSGGSFYRAFRSAENAGLGRRDLLFRASNRLGADINAVDFVRELLVRANGITHSGLFSPLRSHFAAGELTLLSEWAPSVTLAELNSKLVDSGESWPVPVALYVAGELAKTLCHLHSRPGTEVAIVHGFVRPESVFITFDGQVKLLSLGMAAAERYSLQSRQGHVDGAPNYASPEEAAGHEIDGRSDFFSLGTLLWELLVGRPLYPQNGRKEWARVLSEKSVPPPSQSNANVPAELDQVLARLTERDKHLRYEFGERAALDLEAVRKYRFPDFGPADFTAFCRTRTAGYQERYKSYLSAGTEQQEATKALEIAPKPAPQAAAEAEAIPAAAVPHVHEPFKITVEPRSNLRTAAPTAAAPAQRYRIMEESEFPFPLPPQHLLKPLAAAGVALLLGMAFFGHSWLRQVRMSRGLAGEHHRAVSKLMGSLRFVPADGSFEVLVNGKEAPLQDGYAQVPANLDLSVVVKKDGYENFELDTAVMTDEVLDVKLDFKKAADKTAGRDD